MVNSAVTPKKNCWVHGLHKIFATPEDLLECIVVDEYKDQVNEFTVIYVVCDEGDAAIFGPIYKENTKWIIANKTIFGGNALGGVKEYPEILNVKTDINVPIIPRVLLVANPENMTYVDSNKCKWFYYDGVTDQNGYSYHKWLLGYNECIKSSMYKKAESDGHYQYILTLTKHFENSSLEHPYTPDAYMIDDVFYNSLSDYVGSTDIESTDKILLQRTNGYDEPSFLSNYWIDRTGSVWVRLEEGFEVPEENRYFIALGRVKNGKMTIMNDGIGGEIHPIPVEKIISEQRNGKFFVASAHDIIITMMGDGQESVKDTLVKESLWYGTGENAPAKYSPYSAELLNKTLVIDRSRASLTGITRKVNATGSYRDDKSGTTVTIPNNSVEYSGNRYNKKIYVLLIKGHIPQTDVSFSFEIDEIIKAVPLNLHFHLNTRDAKNFDQGQEKLWMETFDNGKKVGKTTTIKSKPAQKQKAPSYYTRSYVDYNITYHKQTYPANLYKYTNGEGLSN